MEFEVCLTYEVEDGVALPLRVRGSRQDFVPENRRGHPDTWTPAEGGELEDLRIISGCRLPKNVEDKLLADDDFLESVNRLLTE